MFLADRVQGSNAVGSKLRYGESPSSGFKPRDCCLDYSSEPPLRFAVRRTLEATISASWWLVGVAADAARADLVRAIIRDGPAASA